jgi:hypothetical protein
MDTRPWRSVLGRGGRRKRDRSCPVGRGRLFCEVIKRIGAAQREARGCREAWDCSTGLCWVGGPRNAE